MPEEEIKLQNPKEKREKTIIKKRNEKKFIDAMPRIIIIHRSFKEGEDTKIVLGTLNKNVFRGGRGLHAPQKIILHAKTCIKLSFFFLF